MERTGFVYLVRCNVYHKIGFSTSPVARVKTIQTDNPEKVTLIAVVPGTWRDEKKWHEVFASRKVHHEWFRLTDEDVLRFISAPGCVRASAFEHKHEGKTVVTELGDFLRRRRLNQERTLREVSSSSGVALGYLSEIERGHKEASLRCLQLICNTLGVQVAEVYQAVQSNETS